MGPVAALGAVSRLVGVTVPLAARGARLCSGRSNLGGGRGFGRSDESDGSSFIMLVMSASSSNKWVESFRFS